jgi:hypothetical protein
MCLILACGRDGDDNGNNNNYSMSGLQSARKSRRGSGASPGARSPLAHTHTGGGAASPLRRKEDADTADWATSALLHFGTF